MNIRLGELLMIVLLSFISFTKTVCPEYDQIKERILYYENREAELRDKIMADETHLQELESAGDINSSEWVTAQDALHLDEREYQETNEMLASAYRELEECKKHVSSAPKPKKQPVGPRVEIHL